MKVKSEPLLSRENNVELCSEMVGHPVRFDGIKLHNIEVHSGTELELKKGYVDVWSVGFPYHNMFRAESLGASRSNSSIPLVLLLL
jgi:hypothetical protein